MQKQTIIHRNPNDLAIHPALKGMPEWSNDDPHFFALIESIREGGVIEPIKITPEDKIADGRHRWRACKKLQVDVPCVIIPESEVLPTIINTLIQRRHYTPGQRAYLVAPLAQDAFQASQNRRIANLKQGDKAPDRNSVPFGTLVKTLEDWAKEVGVSVRYLRDAQKVRELFLQYPDKKWRWNDTTILTALGHDEDTALTFREYYEPQLLDEEHPIGLGAVVAGIGARIQQDEAEKAGKRHGGGAPKEIEKQLDLFTDTFDDLKNRYKYWGNFDEPTRCKALNHISSTIEVMPDDLLKDFSKAVTTEVRRRQKAANANA